jgi:hypothetical protein
MAVKMHDIFEIDVVVQRELAAGIRKHVRGKFVLEVVDVQVWTLNGGITDPIYVCAHLQLLIAMNIPMEISLRLYLYAILILLNALSLRHSCQF